MIDIMGKRNYFFVLSALIILAGIIGFIVNGPQLDISFQGGTIITVEMPSADQDTDQIVNAVKETIGKPVSAQMEKSFTGKNYVALRVSKENTLDGTERSKVIELLRSKFGVKSDADITEKSVEPFIGQELLSKGVQAAIISSLLMIIYLWFRFRTMSGPSAAVFAVVGLIHDLLIMMSVYFIFRVPINESFIAAVLTILGYSINDTIIIYDRIRENTSLLRKLPIDELINRSVVQTMTRSINTVMTVLISIITIYIFSAVNGITSLKEFTFPLIVGITSGCYSSIFISSSLWLVWKLSRQKNKRVPVKASKA